MIIIDKPYIEKNDNKARLICSISEDDELRKIYVEVDKKYEKYLCYERSDAFLIVLFYYAMRTKQNIICKGLITEDLYYQITEYLIPIFEKCSHNTLKRIKIKATLAPNIDHDNGVGTSVTCGVDSFYSIYNNLKQNKYNHKLTHLMIMNLADSYKKRGNYKIISKELQDKAKKVADDLNLPLIILYSNMREIFPIPPMHSLNRLFGVYSLQKLFSIYYFSSSYPIWTFNLEDVSLISSARYDLLICKELSTKNISIYSEGAQLTRTEKIKAISKYDIVRNTLHVCINDSKNCCKCSKCIRTMACLDSLGVLDKYDHVFDIDNYYKNLDFYLNEIVKAYYNHDDDICHNCYRISDVVLRKEQLIILEKDKEEKKKYKQ